MGSKKNAAKCAPKTHKKKPVDSQSLDADDPLPRPVPVYLPPHVPLPINPPPKRVRFQFHNDNNASKSIQPRTTRTQALATTHQQIHPDTSQEAEDPSSSIPNRILPKQKRTAAIRAAVARPAIIANELLDSDASITMEQDDSLSVVQQIGSVEDNYHPPDGDDDHSELSYLSEPLTPPPPPPLPLPKAITTRPRDISTSQKVIAAPTVTTRTESICTLCIL